jgi:hypothetical protein
VIARGRLAPGGCLKKQRAFPVARCYLVVRGLRSLIAQAATLRTRSEYRI